MASTRHFLGFNPNKKIRAGRIIFLPAESRHLARLFGVGELDGVERIAAFGEFEGFDELFLLEVLKEFDDRVTGVTLFVTTGFFKAALLEDIFEGERRCQLPVRLDFNDSAQDVVLELDVHLRVILIGHV